MPSELKCIEVRIIIMNQNKTSCSMHHSAMCNGEKLAIYGLPVRTHEAHYCRHTRFTGAVLISELFLKYSTQLCMLSVIVAFIS